jgi:hypothetical protein
MASRFKYPVYIISKGRYDCALTAINLEKANINYLIAVEPQEYDLYVKKLGVNRILKLPFSNLGLGSYPARNYCWEKSRNEGYTYHFLFDDNIQGWMKWINGKRKYIDDVFSAMKYVELYADKTNIDILGFEEPNFSIRPPKKPFKHNCHVYSAMLIKNELPYRWRLKYNEDVDLCLQVLHNGGTTASCVYYLADKVSTAQKQKGGNQDELYKGNDPKKKLLKAKMLETVWPQYAKTVIRFNRIHHFVDWKVFKTTGKNQGK